MSEHTHGATYIHAHDSEPVAKHFPASPTLPAFVSLDFGDTTCTVRQWTDRLLTTEMYLTEQQRGSVSLSVDAARILRDRLTEALAAADAVVPPVREEVAA